MGRPSVYKPLERYDLMILYIVQHVHELYDGTADEKLIGGFTMPPITI
jgi:hypothetical protein